MLVSEPSEGRHGFTGTEHLVSYAAAVVLVLIVAYPVGSGLASASCDDTDGECDLAGLAGIGRAIIALPVSLVAIAAVEGVRLYRRGDW